MLEPAGAALPGYPVKKATPPADLKGARVAECSARRSEKGTLQTRSTVELLPARTSRLDEPKVSLSETAKALNFADFLEADHPLSDFVEAQTKAEHKASLSETAKALEFADVLEADHPLSDFLEACKAAENGSEGELNERV
eukprot:4932553-Prymnesium_polylepis.1